MGGKNCNSKTKVGVLSLPDCFKNCHSFNREKDFSNNYSAYIGFAYQHHSYPDLMDKKHGEGGRKAV